MNLTLPSPKRTLQPPGCVLEAPTDHAPSSQASLPAPEPRQPPTGYCVSLGV